MCGIAGSVNFRLHIPSLTKDLYHRGPDEQTTFEEGNVQLHHHRLAILDIAGGHQPMHQGNLTIIFNGEIYNHLEVRKKLNLNCHTNSDTETILQAYGKIGPACLQEFDGMFAFVIYDRKKNALFLARDRAGKKPLYYYSDGKSFVFAIAVGISSANFGALSRYKIPCMPFYLVMLMLLYQKTKLAYPRWFHKILNFAVPAR